VDSAQAASRFDLSAGRLRSFLDMITLDARPFLNVILDLVQIERSWGSGPGRPLIGHEHLPAQIQKAADMVVGECKALRLQVAADAAEGLVNARNTQEFSKTLEFVRNAIFIGLNNRKFFEPEPNFAVYFENPKLFGEEVFNAFPSATDDITEAGTCLALERSTACVMHLMRATEAGLRALATKVGVLNQSDWGAYIREIYKELEKQVKAAGGQSLDHQFYAEAAAQIDNVKRAWRNPTMHVDKSYSQPRAEEILLATKSLMSHLAARISE
jgi:hypothetical protein